VLGLAWDQVDLDGGELYIAEQLQRVGGRLIRREVKTDAPEAPLPLPPVCVTALRIRKRQQDDDYGRAADGWVETGLVFTTRHGTPIEPRNFNRSFDRCIIAARVRRITVHGTRKTCASLLAALDVHSRVTRCTGSVACWDDGCCALLLHFSAAQRSKGRFPRREPASLLRGRYWDRTSDLFGVNEALSR
jgi:integrase